MKNWIPKKSLIVTFSTIAALSVILYAGSLFFVTWQINKIESYYSDTESRSVREERSKIIKVFMNENDSYVSNMRKFFIQNGDEVKFIEQIEEVAKSSGIKFVINNIDEKLCQQDSFKEDVNVRFGVEGEWNKIFSFIDQLETMEFGVQVKDFSLDYVDRSTWSGSVDFIVFREK